ncbi:MAG: lamin tail domain-containing protein [Myxococcota bacterium]
MLIHALALLGCTPNTADSGTLDTVNTADTDTPTADSGAEAPTIVINEFMAVNQSTITDDGGSYSDWIELYNPTDAIVSLAGVYLTDEDDEPRQFALPQDQVITPGGYTLFWADAQPTQGEDHTTFKLSGTGEYVGLFFVADGRSPEEIDAVEFGAQTADVSRARIPDGALAWESAASPTPGATNGE